MTSSWALFIMRLKKTKYTVTAKPKHIFYKSLLAIIMRKLYNVTKHTCDSLHLKRSIEMVNSLLLNISLVKGLRPMFMSYTIFNLRASLTSLIK
jgi:hypothetical protein